MPVTGDWVAARRVDPSHALVEAVLPRKTIFSRRAAGKREQEQPVAVNIDLVFLVCGLDADFNLRRLERYLTLAAEARVEPVVVLNKSDLCPDIPLRIRETEVVARSAPVIAANTRSPGGIDGLRSYLGHGTTVALLGSSGVGKSAIVNRILGDEQQRTGEVRQSDGRGCHTTTRRELIPLPIGGALIDTPGMRELQLWAGSDSIDRTFEDIQELAVNCRFRNCSHSGETGCAVAQAIADGLLSRERWTSYRKLVAGTRVRR
jgi:ribosome biogenesis GTPase